MITLKSPTWEIKNVDAVLFDKDGTLIDSHLYWGRIIEKRSKSLIKNLNLNDYYHEEICNVMGYSVSQKKLLPQGPIALVSRGEVVNILYDYFNRNNICISEQEIIDIFVQVHSEMCKELGNYITLIPNVINILMMLKEKKIKTGIITSDTLINTKRILKLLKLERYFDVILGSSTKTTDNSVIIVLDSLNVKASNTVYIGDSPNDIVMSKKSNLSAGIGVALGQTTYDKLLKETKYVLNNFGELNII